MPRLALNKMVASACTALALLASGIASGATTHETVWVLTNGHDLVKVQANQPGRALERKPLTGLPPGDSLVGIDYRVAYGTLFGLSDKGVLYTIDTGTGVLTAITRPGSHATMGDVSFTRFGGEYGFDFNPAADRIRVVNPRRENLRLHPETGGIAATDPNLAYAPTDPNAAQAPRIGAAAYTYNTKNSKLTTNFAIDLALGNLVLQGSREDDTAAVSPNNGVLFTVGSLGLGPLAGASFDIADISNRAFAALRPEGSGQTRLYDVDLATGRAKVLGTLLNGQAVKGIAIEP